MQRVLIYTQLFAQMAGLWIQLVLFLAGFVLIQISCQIYEVLTVFGKMLAFQKFFEHVHGKENGKPANAFILALHKHIKSVVWDLVPTGNSTAGGHPGDGGLKVDNHMFHQMGYIGDFVRMTAAGRKPLIHLRGFYAGF